MAPRIACVGFLFNMANPVLQAQWNEAAPMPGRWGFSRSSSMLRAAKALGLTAPPSLLMRADQIIE